MYHHQGRIQQSSYLCELIQTVGKSCGCRFVYNTFYFQTSNLSGFFCSLTLRVREISRNGNHSFCHFLSQIILSSFLHLLKNHCRNFLRSIQTTVNIHTRSIVVTFHYFIRNTLYFFLYLIPSFTHETFNRENRTRRVGNSLTLSRITYLTFTTIHKSNY